MYKPRSRNYEYLKTSSEILTLSCRENCDLAACGSNIEAWNNYSGNIFRTPQDAIEVLCRFCMHSCKFVLGDDEDFTVAATQVMQAWADDCPHNITLDGTVIYGI